MFGYQFLMIKFKLLEFGSGEVVYWLFDCF